MTSWNSNASWVIPLWVDAVSSLTVSEGNPQKLEERVDEPEDWVPRSCVKTRHVTVDVVMDAIVMNLDRENALSWLWLRDLKCPSPGQQGSDSSFSSQRSSTWRRKESIKKRSCHDGIACEYYRIL